MKQKRGMGLNLGDGEDLHVLESGAEFSCLPLDHDDLDLSPLVVTQDDPSRLHLRELSQTPRLLRLPAF